MNQDQKVVAIGAVCGIASMVSLVALFCWILPPFVGYGEPIARLTFALRTNLLALGPLFIGIIYVSSGRFFSEAIDPLRQTESRSTQINIRFVNNTLEQSFLFVVGSTALATLIDANSLKLILALVMVFVLARFVFWIGYRIKPVYRAAGMAATSFMNLGIFISVLYFLVK